MKQFFSAGLVFVTLLRMSAAEAVPRVNDASENLRSWSISAKKTIEPVAPLAVDVKKFDPLEIICTGMGHRWPLVIFLTRPGEENVVAVVECEPGTATKLNPNGFDYGPIPAIENISRAQADHLWRSRSNSSKSGQTCTYRLTTKGQNEFFLDLVFLKNKLQKYRIRGQTLDLYDRLVIKEEDKLSAWQQVHQENRG